MVDLPAMKFWIFYRRPLAAKRVKMRQLTSYSNCRNHTGRNDEPTETIILPTAPPREYFEQSSRSSYALLLNEHQPAAEPQTSLNSTGKITFSSKLQIFLFVKKFIWNQCMRIFYHTLGNLGFQKLIYNPWMLFSKFFSFVANILATVSIWVVRKQA